MPDYHSPTIVQPAIPLSDASPFELFLLGAMFEAGSEDETSRDFATEYGVDQWPSVSADDLRKAMADSAEFESQVMPSVAAMLAGLVGFDESGHVVLDLCIGFEDPVHLLLLQDIVRRSVSVQWFTCVTAYTCSKPMADGFGGRAALVTADRIWNRSTDELLEEFMSEAKLAPA